MMTFTYIDPSLEGLVNKISHQEIRDVQTCVNNMQYPVDIFIKLPLELSQRVLHYLPLQQAIRARRVSKDWLNILTSFQTTQCLLRPWYSNASTLRIPDGLSDSATSSLKAEHINAYRFGTAFDQLLVQRLISRDGSFSNHVAYSNGKIA